MKNHLFEAAAKQRHGSPSAPRTTSPGIKCHTPTNGILEEGVRMHDRGAVKTSQPNSRHPKDVSGQGLSSTNRALVESFRSWRPAIWHSYSHQVVRLSFRSSIVFWMEVTVCRYLWLPRALQANGFSPVVEENQSRRRRGTLSLEEWRAWASVGSRMISSTSLSPHGQPDRQADHFVGSGQFRRGNKQGGGCYSPTRESGNSGC